MILIRMVASNWSCACKHNVIDNYLLSSIGFNIGPVLIQTGDCNFHHRNAAIIQQIN